MTVGKFVRKGFILRDLLLSMQAENPSPNALTMEELLTIVQECDFQAQLIEAFKSNSEFSLPAYIRQYVRNNTSDITDLPSMQRFFVNPASAAIDTSAASLQRITDAAVPLLKFNHSTKPADFLATKNNPWALQGDGTIFEFTRRATVQINVAFSAAMNVADTAAADLQWRYSDSGTNRIVTYTPTLHIEGALNTGSRMDIPLGTATFFPEHYSHNLRTPFAMGFRLAVLDNTGAFGRVDRITVSVQRSTWVAQSPSGVYDRVQLLKRTPLGQVDTSNYVELIEV